MTLALGTEPALLHHVHPVVRNKGRTPVVSQEYRPGTDRVPHLGVDIMFSRLPTDPRDPPRACGSFYVPEKTLVVALADGTVTYSYVAGNGPRLRVSHPFGADSIYLHLATLFVGAGDFVRAGQVLGEMGGDPSDADPSHTVHLHLGMMRHDSGLWIDPTAYLAGWQILDEPTFRAPTLRSVYGVQVALKQLGFDPGPLDGLDGPRTRAAIEMFQRLHGLAVDGIAGHSTKIELSIRSDVGV